MNNNEMEFEYLNGTQKPTKEHKNIFLKIFVIIGWILYIALEFFCSFIEVLATCFLLIDIKPKKKRKKRWF